MAKVSSGIYSACICGFNLTTKYLAETYITFYDSITDFVTTVKIPIQYALGSLYSHRVDSRNGDQGSDIHFDQKIRYHEICHKSIQIISNRNRVTLGTGSEYQRNSAHCKQRTIGYCEYRNLKYIFYQKLNIIKLFPFYCTTEGSLEHKQLLAIGKSQIKRTKHLQQTIRKLYIPCHQERNDIGRINIKRNDKLG